MHSTPIHDASVPAAESSPSRETGNPSPNSQGGKASAQTRAAAPSPATSAGALSNAAARAGSLRLRGFRAGRSARQRRTQTGDVFFPPEGIGFCFNSRTFLSKKSPEAGGENSKPLRPRPEQKPFGSPAWGEAARRPPGSGPGGPTCSPESALPLSLGRRPEAPSPRIYGPGDALPTPTAGPATLNDTDGSGAKSNPFPSTPPLAFRAGAGPPGRARGARAGGFSPVPEPRPRAAGARPPPGRHPFPGPGRNLGGRASGAQRPGLSRSESPARWRLRAPLRIQHSGEGGTGVPAPPRRRKWEKREQGTTRGAPGWLRWPRAPAPSAPRRLLAPNPPRRFLKGVACSAGLCLCGREGHAGGWCGGSDTGRPRRSPHPLFRP
ncbi:uncharacterized protein LOC141581917 [Saimiri boliviensis]|uniref:uncharacterized protein LOC141581917 n=1 Tax=Saimiri boliviensis TaxID=27679 RepID=UPI003D76BA10